MAQQLLSLFLTFADVSGVSSTISAVTLGDVQLVSTSGDNPLCICGDIQSMSYVHHKRFSSQQVWRWSYNSTHRFRLKLWQIISPLLDLEPMMWYPKSAIVTNRKMPVMLSSRKVRILEDPQGPIFKSLSLSSSSEVQVLEHFRGLYVRGLSWLSVSALCAGVSAGVAMT